MSGKVFDGHTGQVIGERDGPDGKEIAVAVCMPAATWERLSAGLLDGFYGPHENGGRLCDDEAPLALRIGLFLDLELADWEWRAFPERRHIPRSDRKDDPEVPF